MRHFIYGLITGIGIATATAAYAASLVGSGYLFGWDVTVDGDRVCSDPYIWSSVKEIDC